MGFRTKWLAAALLVAGALTTTVGTVFFANATGQFPGGGGRGGEGGRGGGTGSPNTAAALASRMTPQWEYKVANLTLHTANAEKELNKLGDEGWELTLSNDVGGVLVQVFKRQKPRAFPFAQTGGSGGGLGGLGGSGGGADGGTGNAVEKKSESTHVIAIKHAKATALAATIAPLLGSEESANRSPYGGGGGFNPGVRRTSNGRLSIAVDDRTNSIIVITDDANLKTIKELVEKLDVAVKDESKPSK